MELKINLYPQPPVKIRRLLALGYIKYRNTSCENTLDNGSATSNLQVHGLLVVDETNPGTSTPSSWGEING